MSYPKHLITAIIAMSVFLTSSAYADQSKGLNVMVTSPDQQSQMMAMVLSVMTMKKHQKEINMVLCGPAGDLALMSTKTKALKPSGKSPTQLLHALLKMGAKVEVCPLYLPNNGKTEAELIKGISVAKPPVVAGRLLDNNYKILTY
ncbi:MAG: hypothetical protein KAI17_09310 [Thiotrichaceae bacterium]|nr:hypothetical protein [Thiotrichaceae bacterium]